MNRQRNETSCSHTGQYRDRRCNETSCSQRVNNRLLATVQPATPKIGDTQAAASSRRLSLLSQDAAGILPSPEHQSAGSNSDAAYTCVRKTRTIWKASDMMIVASVLAKNFFDTTSATPAPTSIGKKNTLRGASSGASDPTSGQATTPAAIDAAVAVGLADARAIHLIEVIVTLRMRTGVGLVH